MTLWMKKMILIANVTYCMSLLYVFGYEYIYPAEPL